MAVNLKSLIIQQIKEAYGSVKVYEEPVRQGLKTPAFLVLIFSAIKNRKLGDVLERDFTVNVTYFPNTENIHQECDEILQTFSNEFKYISNKYHVHRLEGRVSDDVLVITFNVHGLFIEVFEEVKMQVLGGVNIEQGRS